MSDDIIPRGNCIWKETTHVFYFMKDIIIIITLTVQGSAVTWEFVFKLRRRVVTHNLMYL